VHDTCPCTEGLCSHTNFPLNFSSSFNTTTFFQSLRQTPSPHHQNRYPVPCLPPKPNLKSVSPRFENPEAFSVLSCWLSAPLKGILVASQTRSDISPDQHCVVWLPSESDPRSLTPSPESSTSSSSPSHPIPPSTLPLTSVSPKSRIRRHPTHQFEPSKPAQKDKMAHGGAWTREQSLYLIVMKLCTTLSWKEVAERFRADYGTPTTHKDCESKFNKDLKACSDKEFVARYIQGAWPTSEDEAYIATGVGILLNPVPFDRRLV
jgi:hypothetical protein